jgi:ribosomal-protein-alanine N-acetyltransferase
MVQDRCSTPRLLLRPFVKEDAPVLFRLSREEPLRRHLPDQVYESLKEAEEVIDLLAGAVSRGEWPYVLGITLKDTEELIGHVGLSPVEEGIEIGYAVAVSHQRKGYAAEAVAVFSRWAIEKFHLPCIWAILLADNAPSRRVLEKAGYRFQWEREKQAFGGVYPCLGYLYTQEENA